MTERTTALVRLRRAGDLGALLGGVWFLALLTRGFTAFTDRSFGSDFYDAQAISLLHGHLDVPANIISVEGIAHNGHMFMYYGPFLAIVRLPVMAVAPGIAGQLTQLSMLIGYVILLMAVTRLVLELRQLRTGDDLRRGETIATFAFSFFVATGSVVLFLAGRASVYDETELWGAALTLWVFVLALRYLREPTKRRLGGLVGLGFAVMMTRASVALGPLFVIFVLSMFSLAQRRPSIASRFPGLVQQGHSRPARILAGGLVVTVGTYVAVNWLKFGTLVSVPLNKQVLATNGLDPHLAAFAKSNASFFSLSYLPTTLTWYLRPDTLHLSGLFAFVGFTNHVSVIGNTNFAELTPASSVSASMPWLFALGLIGLVSWWRTRTVSLPTTGRVLLITTGAVVSTIGVLTYAVIAHRYLADALPLLVIGAALGLFAVIEAAHVVKRAARWFAVGAVALMAAWSLLANSALGLQNAFVIRTDVPPLLRASYITFQQSLYHHMVGPHAPGTFLGYVPPFEPQVGDLFVLGHCAGVYQFNSSSWSPVEIGRRGGHAISTVTFPKATSGYEALMSSGTNPTTMDVWAVRSVGNHGYRFAYSSRAYGTFFGLQTWTESRVIEIEPGTSHTVDLVIAAGGPPASRFASVSLDGTKLLSVPYAVSTSMTSRLGSAAGLAPFSGTMVERPTPVPLCHRVRS